MKGVPLSQFYVPKRVFLSIVVWYFPSEYALPHSLQRLPVFPGRVDNTVRVGVMVVEIHGSSQPIHNSLTSASSQVVRETPVYGVAQLIGGTTPLITNGSGEEVGHPPVQLNRRGTNQKPSQSTVEDNV